jgi:hypothetical protein
MSAVVVERIMDSTILKRYKSREKPRKSAQNV